jgi:cytochrome o ubiquinol oxidase subunit III
MSVSDLRYPGINIGATEPETHADAEEKVFGFWVFLMSDLILFSLLFATYAVMLPATAGGPTGKDIFDIKSAAIETGVLLASSFTFGMASLAMKYGRRSGRLVFWLVVTLLLGLTFLGFEVRDFLTMFAKGAVPSRSGFLSAFFALVPTHGLHVTAGCLWIVVMLVQVAVFGIDRNVKIRILRLGLFWHFLDIVWVVIFSVVYLQGLAS